MNVSPAHQEACRRIHDFVVCEEQTAISLSGLGLRSFPDEGLEELLSSGAGKRLNRLDLANNLLTDLPDLFVEACPTLKILFCLSNDFETVPKCLSRSVSLSMLSFKTCRLHGELDAAALPPKLEWLILTGNRITSLSPGFGHRVRRVRKLMLANNLLKTLPENLMSSGMSESLELIRLSNNRLSTIPECLFEARKLAWLGLGGNPCTAQSVKSLKELDSRARIDLSDYELEGTPSLGSGASGDVYLASQRDGDGEMRYAVKLYKSMTTSDGSVLDEMSATLALRSVKGLIPVLGFFGARDDDQSGGEDVGIVMEAVMGMRALGGTPSFASVTRDVYPGDSLLPRIQSVLRIGVQIARAARQTHKLGYAHGDLYGHNILVGPGPKHDCLLTDLGAAYPYLDSRIELVEVRAFGCLLEELVANTLQDPEDSELREEISELSQRCLGDLTFRPRFQRLVRDLEDLAARAGDSST
jgi:Leucine rich repeat/Lipopolysaccharide kinase (Kdo/WaaP) family